MIMLRLRDIGEYESMTANRWGIREPPLTYADGTVREEGKLYAAFWWPTPIMMADTRSIPVLILVMMTTALDETTGGDGLDLILAPGVAFDHTGGRLGHGKGYYDRYLTRAEQWATKRGVPAPVTVALALREQVLPPSERVPADERDRVLDGIIAPDGTSLRSLRGGRP